jgi:hypothetical protein
MSHTQEIALAMDAKLAKISAFAFFAVFARERI